MAAIPTLEVVYGPAPHTTDKYIVKMSNGVTDYLTIDQIIAKYRANPSRDIEPQVLNATWGRPDFRKFCQEMDPLSLPCEAFYY